MTTDPDEGHGQRRGEADAFMSALEVFGLGVFAARARLFAEGIIHPETPNGEVAMHLLESTEMLELLNQRQIVDAVLIASILRIIA